MIRPLALLVAAVAAVAAAEEPSPLIGCWQADEGEAYVRFAADGACTMLDHGQRMVGRAEYHPQLVVLTIAGQRLEAAYTIAGDALTFSVEGATTTCHRLSEEPGGMDPEPLALGAPGPLPPERIAAVQRELASRLVDDQAVRTDRAQACRMAEVDIANTAWLRSQVLELGWIDADRFGVIAANAAFLLVQHSGDTQLMQAALPPIEADVRAGKLDGQPYALLYDRLQLALGGKQRYGSQLAQDAGGAMKVMPLEDRARVDERRAELGLGPLADYLAGFRGENGGRDIPFSEE